VFPGEIAYFRVKGGRFHGCPHDLAEICWFTTGEASPSSPTWANLIRSDERRRGDSIEDQDKGKKWLQNASS
jgi:hypothetical protein